MITKIKINGIDIDVSHSETEIYGLKNIPKLIHYDNNSDGAPFTRMCSTEVSKQNYELVESISKNFMSHGIVEIGVSRNGEGSFTNAMLKNKPDSIPYVGIDIDDKSYLNNEEKKIFTLISDSHDQDKVRDFIKKIGIEKISILFIDGNHSVNSVINDWKYVDLLTEDGIVILHDTNYHPGPAVILDSIDDQKFRIEKHFENQDDYGVTIVYKIK